MPRRPSEVLVAAALPPAFRATGRDKARISNKKISAKVWRWLSGEKTQAELKTTKCCSDVLGEELWRHQGLLVFVCSWRLHCVKEQRAVVPLHRCEDGRQRWEGASRQGGASPQVERHDPLVQAQLAGDAVKRLGVQIQDGDQGGESRRFRRREVPESPRAGGGEKFKCLGWCLAPSAGI